jgi:ligand-binding sensor domain-containing protein
MSILALLPLLAAVQSPGTWEVLTTEDGIPGREVRAVEVTADSAVWLAIRGEGLVRIRGGELRTFTEVDGLVSHGIADLHEDGHGRLWAAGVGGFSVREEGRWTAYRAMGAIRPRVVFGIPEEPSGADWLAANGGAGRTVDGPDGEWEVILPSDGLPHPVVHAVLVDRAGVRWLACRTGLARVAAGRVDTLFPGTNFRSIVEDARGTLWFGTSDGALEWDGDVRERHFPGSTVLPRRAADGVLWAKSPDHGLLRRRDGGWETVPLPPELDGAEIHDLSAAPDGAIWLATSLGAARYTPPS